MPGVTQETGDGFVGYDERPEDLMSSFVPPDPTHFSWTHRAVKGSELKKAKLKKTLEQNDVAALGELRTRGQG